MKSKKNKRLPYRKSDSLYYCYRATERRNDWFTYSLKGNRIYGWEMCDGRVRRYGINDIVCPNFGKACVSYNMRWKDAYGSYSCIAAKGPDEGRYFSGREIEGLIDQGLFKNSRVTGIGRYKVPKCMQKLLTAKDDKK